MTSDATDASATNLTSAHAFCNSGEAPAAGNRCCIPVWLHARHDIAECGPRSEPRSGILKYTCDCAHSATSFRTVARENLRFVRLFEANDPAMATSVEQYDRKAKQRGGGRTEEGWIHIEGLGNVVIFVFRPCFPGSASALDAPRKVVIFEDTPAAAVLAQYSESLVEPEMPLQLRYDTDAKAYVMVRKPGDRQQDLDEMHERRKRKAASKTPESMSPATRAVAVLLDDSPPKVLKSEASTSAFKVYPKARRHSEPS